jgi:CheY-like chemotaxis protein
MKLRILLVEDNALNAELARDLLEVAGHSIDVAETAASFRQLVAVEVFDIVLLDLLLPDGDGRLLLGELRQHPRLAKTPVVALTAQALAGDAERLIAAGFDGVIHKPIEARQFAATVERLAEPAT